jgi:hypothetical protein
MTTSPVMSVSDELLAELELLSSKATQGPWWIDSHGHTMMATDTLDVVFSMPSTKGAVRHPETGNLSCWRNDWDASYIAAANPQNMQLLLSELRSLRAENSVIRARCMVNSIRSMSLISVMQAENRAIIAHSSELAKDAGRYRHYRKGMMHPDAFDLAIDESMAINKC